MDKLAERLQKVSEKRNFLLDKIRQHIPYYVFEANAFFHTFLAFTMAAIMITVFAQLRALKLFAFHPILMSIGTIIFLAEGIVSHSNHSLVDILGPIMQHNKKTKIRVIHQNLNTIGGAFLCMGLLFMFANKFIEDKSLIPQTPHALFGWLCLIGLVIQGVAGSHKLQGIDARTGQHSGGAAGRPYKWHGDSGLLLWDLLCCTILLGMIEFFVFAFSNTLVEMCVVIVWWVVHLQLKKKETHGESGDVHEMQGMLSPHSNGVNVDTSIPDNTV